MKRINHLSLLALFSAFVLASVAKADDDDNDNVQRIQRVERDDDDRESPDRNYQGQARVDRYLDADVWTNRDDGEYYEGDNIVINYRASRDAFVAIYSIDSRGRVNLLFPASPGDDNYVVGGVTYALPGDRDNYDLTVTGPEGREYLQIIASRERFPIPRWWGNSGLVCDWDSRDDFMDDLNERYFVRYPGQSFAYDRAVIFVNEWEPDYYRPVYWPSYPGWSVCGNVYIDSPYGGSVYINGIYWGCAPLYIPRVVVGWHTVTIYDRWGHCWESDFHVSRYNSIVFNREVIRPSKSVVSKYKEVRTVGYRDPVKNGYPQYKVKGSVSAEIGLKSSGAGVSKDRSFTQPTDDFVAPSTKKHLRGNTAVVKTERGFETIPSNTTKGTESKMGSRKYRGSQSGTTESTGSGSSSSVKGRKETVGSTSGSSSSSGQAEIRGRKTEPSPGQSGAGPNQEKPSVQAGRKTSSSEGNKQATPPPASKGSDNGGYKKGGDSGSKSGGENKGKGKP